jgi:sulfite exporter TauE/SafE
MQYWTALILGLVGSLHCAAMCGPLALALPRTGMGSCGFIAGRIAYNLGRIATYCALGVVFGLVGRSLFLAGVQRWASIVLGLVLLVGLSASRRLAFWHPATTLVGWLKLRISRLLRERSLLSLAVLGLLNGLLPCGLVYVACAGATSTNGILTGAAYMCAFGMGTVPMMLGISLSGKLMPISVRMQLRKAVPVSVCLLATLLILRGLSLGIPYVSPDLSLGGTPCCH